ncbi:transposase, partial [Endothiovibrio diazotrophicus]
MPRYRRYTLPDRPVFVTVVTHEREPWLKEPRNAERLLGAMRDVKAHHSFRHLAHVIQPDHFHWLFVP